MKTHMMKAVVIVTLVAAAATARRLQAQGSYSDCLGEAGDSFAACVDDHAWYVAPLCALKFNADALLCAASSQLKR
ncbi:MAG TPA: hypothetical protein VHE78_00900 [Gemmatimonadaceae bacterium]|nr:hypothetical protein [Gemmatimonadaceae bacterium]